MPRPVSEFINGSSTISAKLAVDFQREFGHLPEGMTVEDEHHAPADFGSVKVLTKDCGTHRKFWLEEA